MTAPRSTSWSAAIAVTIPGSATARFPPSFSRSAARTGSRQASRHSWSTASRTNPSPESPPALSTPGGHGVLTASAQPKVLFSGPSALATSDFGPAHGYAVVGVVGPTGLDLWVAPMDSLDKARVLMAAPYHETVPRISPDGGFVAYESQR